MTTMKTMWCVGAVVAMALGAGGCAPGAEPVQEVADGADDAFLAGGKADGLAGQCELDAVLRFVNLPTTTLEVLKAAGVHTRAAQSIFETRAGVDGVLDTKDDVFFETLAQLDAVKYVGPVALEQLLASVADDCLGFEADVVFSPAPAQDNHLTRAAALIDQATSSVDVAMYSFRDAGVRDAMARAVARGVVVRLIFQSALDDKNDPEGTSSARFEELGIDVRYVNKIMHHKFILVDGPTESLEAARTGWLITGSANLSSSAASRYDENTTFLRGHGELMLRFQKEFNHMWDSSRDFEWMAFDKQGHLPIEEADIQDDPEVDALMTSANFDVRDSSRGPTFARVRGRAVVSDRLVELIKGAEKSIWIASGHLRSRPVAEALLEAVAARPELDVRVYLDAQEYISASAARAQDAELEDCLVEAADNDNKREDCLDSGQYYSLALHEAGVPVRFKWYSYRWHYSYAVQMHHKYLIIDGATVASGSYNLSANAEYATLENMVIYGGDGFGGLVDAFVENFEQIWETGRPEGRFEALMAEITEGQGATIPIVFEPVALDWAQVTEYRAATRFHCSDVDDADFRRHPERHHSCTRAQ